MQATNCVHWWVIKEANGETSRGECQRCREVREFANSLPEGGFKLSAKAMRGKSQREDKGDYYPGGDHVVF